MADVREVDASVSKTPIALNGNELATVCVLCSHNCGLRVDVRDGKITNIKADESNPITAGYMCNKAVTIDRYVDLFPDAGCNGSDAIGSLPFITEEILDEFSIPNILRLRELCGGA